MINVKDAVTAAEEFARTLYDATELRHLRLEEVEMASDERHWLVTLGWAEPAVARGNPLSLTGPSAIEKLPRVYKTFKVHADSGEVQSMKIRNVS